MCDSGSDNDEIDNNATVTNQRRNINKPKKHFIHHNNQVIVEDIPNDLDFSKKYKTLDPTYKVRSHHMEQIPANFNRYSDVLPTILLDGGMNCFFIRVENLGQKIEES